MGDQAHSEVDNGTLWTELKHYSKHVTEGGVQTNKSLVQESLEESILKKKVFSLYVLDEGFISKTTNSPFWKFRAGNQQADEVNTNEVTGTDQGQNQPMVGKKVTVRLPVFLFFSTETLNFLLS